MRTILSLCLCAAMTLGATAQNDDHEMKEKAMASAKARTEQLTLQLGLTPEQSEQVMQAMLAAELKALPERQQCKAIEARVTTLFEGAYDGLSANLTPEQTTKLANLRKAGEINTACCDAGDKAGCSHGTAKAATKGSCCAGGHAAAGHGEAPANSLEKTDEGKKTR